MFRKIVLQSSSKLHSSRLLTSQLLARHYSNQQKVISNNIRAYSLLSQLNMRRFSTTHQDTVNASQNSEDNEPVLSEIEKKEFKAETKKLLDIVAKSIYTDKEVFLRELLSNASDALEKLRFKVVSGKVPQSAGDDLYINIITNAKERTITIFDSGVGMSRDEIMDNLGTIAKSGSQAFVQSLKDTDAAVNESIIGQFGVGFYSTFVVADSVEVYSKTDGQKGVRWVSDGTGDYEVSDVENLNWERGTKIVLRLKNECREFCQENEVEKIIKKFSQFISYPIKLNGQLLNNLQAIWYRDKREVTTDEYEQFFETLANTKVPYKYVLHYSTDVPLSIKALLYIPSTHSERMGMAQESSEVNLYSRKILIKPKCQELLPSYLRFIKGVVDCEDLPLNISREQYQDSSLIAKLRNVLTRRVIKMLEDESKRDTEKYNKWYADFNQFIKEGATQDIENQEALLRLFRLQSNQSGKSLISLDEYIAKMKPDQQKIYFVVNPSYEQALRSPYLEPFKGTDVPVLILTNNIDEIVFQQTNQYKGKVFINCETSFEQIQKDLGKENVDAKEKSRIPEEDITPFCLWLKHELSHSVGKVSLSKRLTDTPAIVVGQMSSSMRMMMQMMESSDPEYQSRANEITKNQALEINAAHPIIVNLNHLRKNKPELASLLSNQMLDNVLIQSGIAFDMSKAVSRSNQVLEQMLDEHLGAEAPQRKLKSQTTTTTANQDDNESALNQTHRDIKRQSHHTGKKVVSEHTVTGKE